MHRVKGLQFNYVLLPALNADMLPLKAGLDGCADDTSQSRFMNGERCLLHVAATRAKKQVLVTYCGQPSRFLGNPELGMMNAELGMHSTPVKR